MGLSVGIITYNEEKNILKVIKSVEKIADEIIIVDSNSTDNTVDLAKKNGAQVFIENWKGYGPQKNSVIEKCNHDWILLIDADEVVSEKLRKRIFKIINNKPEFEVYKINFTAVCFGKTIKYGGWSNHYRIRLFRRGSGLYNDREVHEKFVTKSLVGKIKEDLYHYTYDDITDYFNKMNRYTSEAANHYKLNNKKKTFLMFYFDSIFKFFKMYIIKLGFLDGYKGYLLAKLASIYVFVKYAKLKERNEK